MKIILHKDFKKQFKKLQPSDQKRFQERRDVFLANPFDLSLNNHALRGKYSGYRSINLTGDKRIVFRELEKDLVVFAAVGTHSDLYE